MTCIARFKFSRVFKLIVYILIPLVLGCPRATKIDPNIGKFYGVLGRTAKTVGKIKLGVVLIEYKDINFYKEHLASRNLVESVRQELIKRVSFKFPPHQKIQDYFDYQIAPYIDETSYGKTSVEAQVFGPYAVSLKDILSVEESNSRDTGKSEREVIRFINDSALEKIKQDHNLIKSDFDYLVVYSDHSTAGGGRAFRPPIVGSIPSFHIQTTQLFNECTFFHEFGHAFGLPHYRVINPELLKSIRWETTLEQKQEKEAAFMGIGVDPMNSCSFGIRPDFRTRPDYEYPAMSYSGLQRIMLGWVDKQNIELAQNRSTHDIYPIQALVEEGKKQVIVVPRFVDSAFSGAYFIDFRVSYGSDDFNFYEKLLRGEECDPECPNISNFKNHDQGVSIVFFSAEDIQHYVDAMLIDMSKKSNQKKYPNLDEYRDLLFAIAGAPGSAAFNAIKPNKEGATVWSQNQTFYDLAASIRIELISTDSEVAKILIHNDGVPIQVPDLSILEP